MADKENDKKRASGGDKKQSKKTSNDDTKRPSNRASIIDTKRPSNRASIAADHHTSHLDTNRSSIISTEHTNDAPNPGSASASDLVASITSISSDENALISDSSEFMVHHRGGSSASPSPVSSLELQRKSLRASDNDFLSHFRRSRQSSPGVVVEFKREERSNSLDDDYEIHSKVRKALLLKTRSSSSGSGASTSDNIRIGSRASGFTGVAATPGTWEHWWVSSPNWLRSVLFILFLLLLISIVHLVAALWFFGSHTVIVVHDPHVCTTTQCRTLSKWLNQSVALDVNPCANFYDFACGHHKPTDTGNLWSYWEDNIARLETDGENGDSIMSKVLKKPEEGDILGERIVKYYQVCMEMWQVKSLSIPDALTTWIGHVFKDFEIWGDDSHGLERAAAEVIRFLGDDGFYKTEAPVFYREVILSQFFFPRRINKANVAQFLPMIYDALNITKDNMTRKRISTHLYRFTGKLYTLIYQGLPEHPTCPDKETLLTTKDDKLGGNNFDFDLPFYLAYFGEGSVNWTVTPPSLEPGKGLTLTIDPRLITTKLQSYFETLRKNWNCWINTQFKPKDRRYIRPVYATFWSLRLLIELVHDVNDETAKDYKMADNEFFTVFKTEYWQRDKESRCFQSLVDAMGYYPVFRYFKGQRIHKDHLREAMTVIRDSANAILEEFRPQEEGGLTYVSSRYRERAYLLLSDPQTTDVIIPMLEDDPTFIEDPEAEHLAVGEDHAENIFKWRKFTFNRTRWFWKSSSPQGRLVWHKTFYAMDKPSFYGGGDSSKVLLVLFPPSIFVFPFWNNDIEMANYAGARVIAAKIWMTARLYYSRFIEENLRKTKAYYYEGIATDADYTTCDILTYSETARHTLQTVTRHGLCFNWLDNSVGHSGIWGNSLPISTILRKFYEDIEKGKRTSEAWEHDAETRRRIMATKLEGYEDFTEEQLYFLLNYRETCRSNDFTENYHKHVATNLAAIMHTKEFARVWKCPPNSPMNPEQCFVKKGISN